MNALKICHLVKEQIYNDTEIKGVVHSTFNRACNLIIDDKLISILSYGKSMAPMSVLIKEQNSFIELGISQGMEVTLGRRNIVFHPNELELNLIGARVWDPKPSFPLNKSPEKDVLNKLEIIEEYILNHGKLEGIAPLVFKSGRYIEELDNIMDKSVYHNGFEAFIFSRFISFLDLVRQRNTRDISKASRLIIGFGPGLTPSTDDFISGLMVALVYLCDYFNLDVSKAYELNKEIVKEINNKTTKISEKMLKYASKGEVSDNIRKVMVSLLVTSSQEEFIKNLLYLLDFGETSGTDTLCGIYTGCRIMFNDEVRRLFGNGD